MLWNPTSLRQDKETIESDLRDWFAGMALIGLTGAWEQYANASDEEYAARAYALAEAMLNERRQLGSKHRKQMEEAAAKMPKTFEEFKKRQ